MALQLHNSLTDTREEFLPENPEKVRIYNCGPTVYNFNHIGNFRSYASVDVLRRYLKFRGFGLDHTSNITDVDDKIIRNAMEKKLSIDDFTAPFIQAFLEDLSLLRIENVEHRPRATRSIPGMIRMIGEMEKRGHTYTMDNSIYFRIASFPGYGRLSKLDPESLRAAAGGRFDADEYTKEDVRDFALWKSPASPDEPSWDSPWGPGRPGWHLECSAMIRDIYGNHGVDIHCGGVDLLFPHHENEIAQSRCAYPDDNFARYWFHNEHLLVDGKKMSKSAGNFFTLRDLTRLDMAQKLVDEGRAPAFLLSLIEKGRIARALRYLLVATHYRTKLNFTFENLRAADAACERIQSALDRLLSARKGTATTDPHDPRGTEALDPHLLAGSAGRGEKPGYRFDTFASGEDAPSLCLRGFLTAMDDDLNISKGLASVFDYIRDLNVRLEKGELPGAERERSLTLFAILDSVLDIMDFSDPSSRTGFAPAVDGSEVARIQDLIDRRNAARKAKDFAGADRIRRELDDMGILIKDTPTGTVWEKK